MPSRPGADPALRVLVADDDVAFAETLETLLDAEQDIEVVGRAASGVEAVELAASLQPDVVVMDLTMPLMDGLEATRRIHEGESGAQVVVLTESDFRADVVRAERAGAAGYLPKTHIVPGLREAIRAAAGR